MRPRLSLRRHKIRGVVLSTEMILLLTAVIMFSVIAFFGISKIILSQATSQKYTLVIVRAEAWKIGSSSGSGIAVSMYLQNTGSDIISISGAGIKYLYRNVLYICSASFPSSISINPGESKVVSFVVANIISGGGTACSNVNMISAGDTIYVYVTYSNQEVGTAVKVASP